MAHENNSHAVLVEVNGVEFYVQAADRESAIALFEKIDTHRVHVKQIEALGINGWEVI